MSEKRIIEINGTKLEVDLSTARKVVDKFNQEIEKKKAEMDELIGTRDWFEKHFAKYFESEGAK